MKEGVSHFSNLKDHQIVIKRHDIRQPESLQKSHIAVEKASSRSSKEE